MIRLYNARGGLATNSSSSHSLIILPGPVADDDLQNDDGSAAFGWQYFTAGSDAAKRAYLGLILHDALGDQMPDDLKRLVICDWLGLGAPPEGYVDHDSVFGLPVGYGSAYLSNPFFEDLRAFVLRPDVAILGGNDNTEEDDPGHPLWNGNQFRLPLPGYSRYNAALVARKDPRFGFWTLFNPETGGKLRFSFVNDPAGRQRVWRAFAPELVDLKITQFCPFAGNGCSVPCYQGSDQTGTHAEYSRIVAALDALARLEVFEVAIGGGEPTLHPMFLDILTYARTVGIVPNFTTRNIAWLRDPRQWVSILAQAGAFAYSAQNSLEIIELGSLIRLNGIAPGRVHLHLVMGTMSEWVFRAMLRAAQTYNFPVTLLGYKRTGRGATTEPEPYADWWLRVVQELREQHALPPISIDTPLAAEHETALRSAGIPRWMFHTQEGTFSAYLDAVSWHIGPSSFEGPEAMIALPTDRILSFGPDSDGAGRIAEAITAGMATWAAARREGSIPDLEED
jgi:hypothetical protein